ncbi:unnamed protein product [Anisakis simplex]|uniref:Protein kinase domain-containing protein n=1 Tax=Anisakis simplex TaxID=6269 RepID=A0A3P6Q8G9_ANISI|nr:unnamed protein product [Anisakis simplex]
MRRVPYDKSCDMWSLGVVMYMLLCGLAPFYPHSDSNFSNGMQKRIKKGVYKFPSPEWDQISEQGDKLFGSYSFVLKTNSKEYEN